MRLLLVLVGTILAVLFIIQLKKGSMYQAYVEGLDEQEYPMHELYIVGFAWSTSGIFRLKGKVALKLKTLASLLYEPQYSEYYANVVWAQTITLTHLFLTVTFLIAGVMYESVVLMLGAGLFMSVMMAVYCIENMKNILESRTQECEMQLPEVVSSMAILVNSGMVLREAWATVADSGTGAFYQLMRTASVNMKNGYSDADAIFIFGRSTNSTEIKKFTSALLQSLEKGGAELGVFLTQQSSEIWNTKRQKMLQSGEKAATKLLLPIVLIFVGILIIVMTAAFAGSLF